MFNSSIEGFLRGTTASSIAEVFLWVILGVLIFALYKANQGKQSQFTYQAPNILTSLGILGTFTGIVIGLLDFNFGSAEDINQSIPTLLGGLKTAFITSLAGMAAAIVFKGADSLYFAEQRQKAEDPDEVTPNHIHAELKASNENLLALKKALAGEEDSSLVGVMKLARADQREAFEKQEKYSRQFAEDLFHEMRNFADILSKSATETVVEALKQVIVEFNEKLTEQFGDNFKRLDESVKKLVDWQKQYMEQMEQMAEHYGEGVKAIDATKVAVVEIGDKTAEIPKSMAEMQTVLQVNQHQIQELQRHLEAFVEMKVQAREAIPDIQGQLDHVTKKLAEAADAMESSLREGAGEFGKSVELTNQSMRDVASNVASNADEIKEKLTDSSESIAAATRDMMDSLEKGADSLRTSVNESIDGALQGIRDSIEKSVGSMESELNRVIKDAGVGIEDANKAMVQHLQSSARDLQQSLESSVDEVLGSVRDSIGKAVTAIPNQVQESVDTVGKGISKQVEIMDQQMSEEVTRVITNMGGALARVTERFTSDYSQLIQQMEAVLRNQPDQRP